MLRALLLTITLLLIYASSLSTERAWAGGWYLMIPPAKQLNAPGPVTREWKNLRAFDSAEACEAALADARAPTKTNDLRERQVNPEWEQLQRELAGYKWAIDLERDEAMWRRALEILEKDKAFMDAAGRELFRRAGRCVASDDPRLR